MKDRQVFALMLSLILCAVAVVALLLSPGSPSHAQTPTPRYVAVGGSDITNNCTNPSSPCGTVQHAVDVAVAGDVVKVATGTYTGVNSKGGLSQVVYIDKSLIIRGGYDVAFLDPPDPATYPTTLDAEGQGRVVFATGASVSTTLEGLHLTGGNAKHFLPEDAGGGALCADDVHYVLLSNSVVVSNTADIGGGVYYHRCDSSLLAASEIYSNTARAGAGIYFHNTGNPKLADSEVYSNTSESNGAGVYLASGYYDTELTGNTIHHNDTTGGGGGVYLMGTNDPWLYSNRIYSNTATAQGGGLYLSGSRNSEVTGNTISDNEGGTNGGGLYVRDCDGCTFVDNEISGNRIIGITGGGIFLSSSDRVTFEDNRIHDNVAEANWGGGLFVTSCPDLSLVGNSIYGNAATGGGGLCFSSTSSGVTVAGNEVYSNTASNGGGIYLSNASGITLDSNEVYTNTASDGGGIRLDGGTGITLKNNILWANEATSGSGIRVHNAGAQFLHNTITRNVGDGIAVFAGTLRMTNTILVKNSIGVRVWSNCTATLANTLWGVGDWANTADWVLQDGTSTLETGTENFWEYPIFVDAVAGDYHIEPTSGAIDRGAYAGVLGDIDGEPRLYVPDLGADEYWPPGMVFEYVYLPLTLRNAP